VKASWKLLSFYPRGTGWASDRERLWNEANRAEERAKGRFATELELALPHELDAAQRRKLAETFAHQLADQYEVAVDVASSCERRACGSPPPNPACPSSR
jgi:hypothetical protein